MSAPRGSETATLGLGNPITPAEREKIQRAWRSVWPSITLGEWIRQTLLKEAETQLRNGNFR